MKRCAGFLLFVLSASASPTCLDLHSHALYLLSHSIARHEGWGVPTSPVRLLHNPGALAFAGQPYASRTYSGYAAYPDDRIGWASLYRDLEAKIRLRIDLYRLSLLWNRGGYFPALVSETQLLPYTVLP